MKVFTRTGTEPHSPYPVCNVGCTICPPNFPKAFTYPTIFYIYKYIVYPPIRPSCTVRWMLKEFLLWFEYNSFHLSQSLCYKIQQQNQTLSLSADPFQTLIKRYVSLQTGSRILVQFSSLISRITGNVEDNQSQRVSGVNTLHHQTEQTHQNKRPKMSAKMSFVLKHLWPAPLKPAFGRILLFPQHTSLNEILCSLEMFAYKLSLCDVN